jgi:DUF1365 family protein
MAVIENALVNARVMHVRLWPRRHQFIHSSQYLMISLQQITVLKNFRWLSYNRNNFFQLRDRDYGFETTETLNDWARRAARESGANFNVADIQLVSMPRTLGYGFNPVSFWLYFDNNQNLRAVMVEVNNTFHQRHAYWCMHPDQRAIMPGDIVTRQKHFHVSPFFDVEGEYQFRFNVQPKKIAITIDYWCGQQQMMTTSLTGTRAPLSDHGLWRGFWRTPWSTVKTILLIHGHALLLIAKRMRYRPPATLPEQNITS